jgi:hypothetical protein
MRAKCAGSFGSTKVAWAPFRVISLSVVETISYRLLVWVLSK